MDRETATPAVESFPGPRAREWIDAHHRHAAPSEYSHEFVWDVTGEAVGPFVSDLDGNVLLDFTSHIGAAPLGYNNPKLRERMADVDIPDPLKIAGQDFYFGSGTVDDPDVPGATQLMERLVEASAHYDMDTVFLCNSGAEAIENAMKISYANTPQPKYGITFEGSFHGRTLGTLSVTRTKHVYTRKYPEIAGTRTFPFCTDRRCTADTCDCGFFDADGSNLRRVFDPKRGYLDPDEVAYLVLEPVQGVGGYRFPSEAFMREVNDVCAEYDIHLVVDEIQSGVGRTGTMWASDQFPIEPDVICSAKALRSAATISRTDVFPSEKNRIGSTWGGGDLLASMQGVFTLDIIDEYDLLDNATSRGEQFTARLREADLDGVIDIRGMGLMLAVEFDTGDRRTAVVAEALERGMLLLGCGPKTIRVLPPLDVTEREIDLGAEVLIEAIAATN
ncbi:aspartate aminotransferase family protein [Haloferacaceae archaeon DSL9]